MIARPGDFGALWVAAAFVWACATRLGAQTAGGRAARTDSVGASQVQVASGRVVLARGDALIAVPNAGVVLHRVGTDAAGPIDSLRTGANGEFRFRYRRTGDPAAAYIVSTVHGGIAYFSERLATTDRSVSATPTELIVYDTTSRAIPIGVASRHLIVAAADTSAAREITEVLVLVNAGDITRVAGRDSGATFRMALPRGARGFRVGESEVSPASIRFADGALELAAPLAPGTKRVSISYRLAPAGDQLAFPLDAGADVLEVLVEDSTATAIAEGLAIHEAAPVILSGRPFRRFLGSDVVPGARLAVRLAPHAGGDLLDPRNIAIVTALVMMIALLWALAGRTGKGAATVPPADVAGSLAPAPDRD